MRKRGLLLVVVVLWGALLWYQTRRLYNRIRASVILYQVEGATLLTTRSGPPASSILERNLYLLDSAGAMDPGLVGIPVARGSQYLLLRRPHAAIRAYEEALKLEPRPETYLNLGRALLMANQAESALDSFDKAVTAAPRLSRDVPSQLRDQLRPTRREK